MKNLNFTNNSSPTASTCSSISCMRPFSASYVIALTRDSALISLLEKIFKNKANTPEPSLTNLWIYSPMRLMIPALKLGKCIWRVCKKNEWIVIFGAMWRKNWEGECIKWSKVFYWILHHREGEENKRNKQQTKIQARGQAQENGPTQAQNLDK